ncbi:MATE family efflux transporter, partial [Flavobacteriaceae bacterium]|nr:MATE family efflux transporter [Flavobacteriaceae bacterium]
FLPAVVGKSIYPSLIELNKKNKLKYKRVVKAILGFSIVFSFVLGLFISLFSNEIINLLFGEKYYLAASYLNTYIWSIIPSLAFFVFAQIFYIEKLIKNTFIISLSSIVLNTILNYIWITKIGVFGALYASIVTSLITNFLFIYIIYKKSTIFKSND